MKLGSTGKFPRGKLSPTDEGQLNLAISHDNKGNVHINFGEKVVWIAMQSDQAIEFGLAVLKHAGADVAVRLPKSGDT